MSIIEQYRATTATTTVPSDDPAAIERTDLLDLLTRHRFFLRVTVEGLDDAAAARRTTVSELCLGGLIKHVAHAERGWVDFVVGGPDAMGGFDEEAMTKHAESFQMLPGETLAGLLTEYAEVAERTDTVLAVVDLNSSHPLPEAPWFSPGDRWTARRVFSHIVAETAQHAGHADIVRESLDGARTMG